MFNIIYFPLKKMSFKVFLINSWPVIVITHILARMPIWFWAKFHQFPNLKIRAPLTGGNYAHSCQLQKIKIPTSGIAESPLEEEPWYQHCHWRYHLGTPIGAGHQSTRQTHHECDSTSPPIEEHLPQRPEEKWQFYR